MKNVTLQLFNKGKSCEEGGIVRFDNVVKELTEYCKPDELMAFLNSLAEKLIGVPVLLEQHGCPREILEFPAIGFNNLESKLANFGVHNG
jgi:serine/threonine-protein kinase HipA